MKKTSNECKQIIDYVLSESSGHKGKFFETVWFLQCREWKRLCKCIFVRNIFEYIEDRFYIVEFNFAVTDENRELENCVLEFKNIV